jgi:hypothetical protein
MFACWYGAPPVDPPILPNTRFQHYVFAGITFTDGKNVLCYNCNINSPSYRINRLGGDSAPCIAGFSGGRHTGDRDWVDTAWRETIQDLWGIMDVPRNILNQLRTEITHQRVVEHTGSVIIILDLKVLLRVCQIMQRNAIKSPVYAAYPRGLEDLLLTRDPAPAVTFRGHHITHLCIIPLQKTPSSTSRSFIRSMETVLDAMSSANA